MGFFGPGTRRVGLAASGALLAMAAFVPWADRLDLGRAYRPRPITAWEIVMWHVVTLGWLLIALAIACGIAAYLGPRMVARHRMVLAAALCLVNVAVAAAGILIVATEPRSVLYPALGPLLTVFGAVVLASTALTESTGHPRAPTTFP